MAEDRHRAVQHRSAVPGIEAVTASSDRSFPRHAHDQLGFGVVDFGAHRSWSGIGAVEAAPGDCIMVNPGEIHDGVAVDGGLRGLRSGTTTPGIGRALRRIDDAPEAPASLAELAALKPVRLIRPETSVRAYLPRTCATLS